MGGALVVCAVAAVICFFAVTYLKAWLKYDDSLDTFGVHCVGGIIGSLGTGIFVNPKFGEQPYDYVANKVGDFDAMGQIVSQLWDILKNSDWHTRKTSTGNSLDLADHGENAYNL